MKKSLFILAVLAMSPALYAQADSPVYTPETVWEIFAKYNPAVLEKAQQNVDYNSILESFVSSYQEPRTDENRYELIAAVRNFDDSIRLKALTLSYEQAFVYSQMGGGNLAAVQTHFRQELLPIFQRIWAVTVHLRGYEIEECEAKLKQLRKDKTLSKEERSVREAELKRKIAELKKQYKALQQNPGDQILAATDAYIAQTNQQLAAQLQAAIESRAQSVFEEAAQADNLQIKTKNKKPVAK